MDSWTLFIGSILFFFQGVVFAQTAQRGLPESKVISKEITLMGIGDSITEGGENFSSYLFPLHYLLMSKGLEVRFTGPRQSNYQGLLLRHAGYSGSNTEYLASIVDSVYAEYQPEIVLVHSGHNHFDSEKPIGGILQSLQRIVSGIKNQNPESLVFVAQVITSGKLPKYSYIPELNKKIDQLVFELNTTYSGVFLVNVNKDFNWKTDTVEDLVHPNSAGALKIAKAWMEVLIPALVGI